MFLSGCGVFNLSNFVMTDDLEFLALVEELVTPKKIVDYMSDNFTFEQHNYYALNPYILWKIKLNLLFNICLAL